MLEEAEPLNTNNRGSKKQLEAVSPGSRTDAQKSQQPAKALNSSVVGHKELGDVQFPSLEELRNESKIKILKELMKTQQLTKSSQEVSEINPRSPISSRERRET